MSIKIYNAFECKLNDWFDLHNEVQQFRNDLSGLVKQKVAKVIGSIASGLYDRDYFGLFKKQFYQNQDLRPTPLLSAFHEFEERVDRVKKTRIRDSAIDFSFEIAFFPDDLDSRVFGIVYTEVQDFKTLWFSKPFIADFHYQNQSDKPETVTDWEWDQRREIWDRLLPDANPIPSMNSFTAQIVQCDFHVFNLETEALESNLPSVLERAKAISEDVAFETFLKLNNITETKDLAPYFKFKDWLLTDSGKVVYGDLFEHYATQMKPLTRQLLALEWKKGYQKPTRTVTTTK